MMKNMSLLEDYIPKENLRQLQAAIEKDQAVQRHVEQLTPYDGAMYLLANGSTNQKISMLQRLHITLRDCDEKKTSQLLGELTQAMWTQELELQIAAPEAIITVLPRLNENQVNSLLNGVKNMLAVKGEEARNAWSKLAVEIVPYLPKDTIVNEFVPLVLKKCQHAEPPDQRLLAARLVGKICKRLAQAKCVECITSSGLLNRAIGLCQDTERYMRAEMCSQLIEIARAVGPATTKEKITSELFQLVADEEPPVARAALSAVVLDFVDFYDAQYRKEHVWPVLRSYLQSPQDEFVSLLAEVFGRFLCKIKADLQTSPEDVTLLANFFKMCSQRPDAELRRWCAFNFPAVVTVFPYSVFSSVLSPVLKSLASDSHVPTRKCVAAGLHELIPLLGDRAAQPLKEPVLLLIQDSTSLEVRHIIFRKLGSLLDLFGHQLRNDEREAFFSAVIPHIISYEAAVHRDWRASSILLESYKNFTRYFPGHILSQKFVNPLLQHLLTGAAAVKELCVPLLIQFTRALNNNQAIAERYGKIVSEFGRSGNAHHRKTFIMLFCASVGMFSRKFLRIRMLERLLELADDPIPNVRMHLARVMPIVRRVLRAPCEAEWTNSFQQAWGKLCQDSDPDVRDTAARIQGTLEDLERDYSRQAAMRIISNEDTQDRKREEMEGDLSDLSRELEKTERRQRLREMLMKEQAEMGLLDDVPGVTTSGVGRSNNNNSNNDGGRSSTEHLNVHYNGGGGPSPTDHLGTSLNAHGYGSGSGLSANGSDRGSGGGSGGGGGIITGSSRMMGNASPTMSSLQSNSASGGSKHPLASSHRSSGNGVVSSGYGIGAKTSSSKNSTNTSTASSLHASPITSSMSGGATRNRAGTTIVNSSSNSTTTTNSKRSTSSTGNMMNSSGVASTSGGTTATMSSNIASGVVRSTSNSLPPLTNNRTPLGLTGKPRANTTMSYGGVRK